MAVHLKMDFRVVELAGNLSVLQCDRGDASCLYEVEFNPRLTGSLVGAIRQLRTHRCGEAHAASPKSTSARRILNYPAASSR
ncbi:MAG TPA: hypothetical protein VM554_03745 [Acidisarcina sp.]|nr:hypothetical protein [Acidisarcina sp.]